MAVPLRAYIVRVSDPSILAAVIEEVRAIFAIPHNSFDLMNSFADRARELFFLGGGIHPEHSPHAERIFICRARSKNLKLKTMIVYEIFYKI